MNISIYKNALDHKGTTDSLIAVLKRIKNGTYAQQIKHLRSLDKEQYAEEKKSLLPAATFSGLFEPTRLDANLRAYSGLITCDIDHLLEEEFDDTRAAICADAHTYCLFTSPGGDGLKVLVPVTSGKEHHKQAFNCVREYFLSQFGVELDPSGKNEARLCFVSHDPDLYFNGKATPLPVIIDEAVAKTVYSDRTKTYGDFRVTEDDRKKYEVCAMWADFYTPYQEGQRNTHIYKLSCNLNRVGVKRETAMLMILRDKTDFPVDECKDVVYKCYAANASEHGTQSIYDFEQEQDAQRGMLEYSSPGSIMERLINAPVTGLIPTGYPKRDMMFGGGMQRSSVYAYIGREKTFKSVDAIRTACHVAAATGPVLYFNGEMSELQYMQIVAQQELGVRRIHFQQERERIAEYYKNHLGKLCIVSGSDFTRDQAEKTINAMRIKLGEDPVLIIYDGLKQMSSGRQREAILSMIENAGVAKEVAKTTNCAVVVLIHTDAKCKYWHRNPRDFVLGKTQVTRNFDGSVSFSRFIQDGSFQDEYTYELRNDVYCVKVQDDRLTGESDFVVMDLSTNVVPAESEQDIVMLEVKMNED